MVAIASISPARRWVVVARSSVVDMLRLLRRPFYRRCLRYRQHCWAEVVAVRDLSHLHKGTTQGPVGSRRPYGRPVTPQKTSRAGDISQLMFASRAVTAAVVRALESVDRSVSVPQMRVLSCCGPASGSTSRQLLTDSASTRPTRAGPASGWSRGLRRPGRGCDRPAAGLAHLDRTRPRLRRETDGAATTGTRHDRGPDDRARPRAPDDSPGAVQPGGERRPVAERTVRPPAATPASSSGACDQRDPSPVVTQRVTDVVLRLPKTLPSDVSIADARAALRDDHIHMLLLTEGGRLLGTLLRSDLPASSDAPGEADDSATPALPFAALAGRMVSSQLPAQVALEDPDPPRRAASSRRGLRRGPARAPVQEAPADRFLQRRRRRRPATDKRPCHPSSTRVGSHHDSNLVPALWVGGACRAAVESNDQTSTRLLRPGDLLLVDEAGMLDQDTARALLTIADESRRTGRVRRRPTPAPRRRPRRRPRPRRRAGPHPTAVVTLDTVHRFADPDLRRPDPRGCASGDRTRRRCSTQLHRTRPDRRSTPPTSNAPPPLAATSVPTGDLVVADTREQVADLNAAIRDQRDADAHSDDTPTVIGDQPRRADRRRRPGRDPPQRPRPPGREPADLDRHRHRAPTVSLDPPRPTDADQERPGRVRARARRARLRHHRPRRPGRDRRTAPTSLLGETTGAAAAYVGMTRGRETNTAHLVADSLDEARAQWIETFSRSRADLETGHARHQRNRRPRPLRTSRQTAAPDGRGALAYPLARTVGVLRHRHQCRRDRAG